MYAKGKIYENIEVEVISKVMVSQNPINGSLINHQEWPNKNGNSPEIVKGQSFLILDHPQVVGHYPVKSNYRTLINPDMILYPVLGSPVIQTGFFNDGLLMDTATIHTENEPSLDWSLMDPTPGAGKDFDIFRRSIDVKSY
jgi:hypothetical protein